MTYREVDGLLWPTFFEEENYHRLKNLELRPGDVIQSTYPKSGTNWVSYIISRIAHPLDDPPTGNKVITEDVTFVDKFGFASWDAVPAGQPRYLATHVPVDKLPKCPDAKYIVTVRNPFDCCASFYHFHIEFIARHMRNSKHEEIEYLFEDFLSGKMPFGGYWEHLLQWYHRRHEPNVLFSTYESLKSNPRNGILDIARFLGLEKPLEADNGKLLDKIVHQSSFSSMKDQVKYFDTDEKAEEIPVIRKGQVGGFREVLSRDQETRMRSKMEELLAGTELLQEWANI